MSRLDEIEAREKVATKGPWHYHRRGKFSKATWIHTSHLSAGQRIHYAIFDTNKLLSSGEDIALAEFVSNARQDIPYLLRVARAAEKLMPLCADFCGTCVETNCETCEVTMAKEEFKNAMEDKNA